MSRQQTVAREVSITPVGARNGRCPAVLILPADPGRGFHVIGSGTPEIPVRVENVQRCFRGITLGVGDAAVARVEHILAALTGLGVTNATIRVDGSHVPPVDGAALPFVQGILDAGLVEQPGTLPEMVVRKPVSAVGRDCRVDILPGPESWLEVEVHVESLRLGSQSFVGAMTPERFASAVAPTRVPGSLSGTRGLGPDECRGGATRIGASLPASDPVCPPCRWPREEAVQHGVLDLLGGLALLEYPLRGRVVAQRVGHGTIVAALRRLLARPECWELVDPERQTAWTVHPYSGEQAMVALGAG